MTTGVEVSVVVIFLDGEAFLAEAIDSVFAQTLEEWELILVDDGSTDGATAIARRCAAEHPDRVRYLEHPSHVNHGMSASRNLGMQHARGRFIALLDADDVWLPEKLAEQVQLLDAHPTAAMVYGPGLYWYGWTGRVEDQGRDFVQPLGVRGDTLVPAGELVPVFVRRPEVSPSMCTIMVRTSVVRTVGGGEASFRGMYEDQVLCCKVALVHAVWVSRRVWFRYRQHDRSCCAEAFRNGSHLAARKQFLRWLRAYLPARAPEADLAARVADEQWRQSFGLAARIKTIARRILPLPLLRWIRNHL